MTKYYIWLLQVMGSANPRSISLIKHFGSAEMVYEKAKKGETGFFKSAELIRLKNSSIEKAEEILQQCEKSGYKTVTFFEDDYPGLLRNIFNPPIMLFYEGNISCLNDEICVTIVGTREPSDYSVRIAETVSKKLSELGIVIVSGFALGIDKASQIMAYKTGGKTAGVLACGIDYNYPKGSIPFRKKVAESGGAAISELLPGTGIERGYFHLRNRLMSGLSQGTLIVEAGQTSGCHITADYALSQNRDLFCVPPADVFLERYSGVVRYLRDGAIPVFSYIDIVQQYKSELEIKILENEKYDKKENTSEFYGGEKTKSKVKRVAPLKEIIPEKPPAPDLSALSPVGSKLAELLATGDNTVDYLVQNTEYDLSVISDALLDMELDGIVESLPGARYRIRESL